MDTKVCEGVAMYEKCKRSGDCAFGSYCSGEGICMPLKEKGEPCYLHEECERGNMCFYYSPSDFFGYCTAIFSRDVRELAMPLINKVPADQGDMEKLC